MKYDVFISYSSKNSTAAIAICHLLEDSGVRCWMAPRDIPLGEKYATVITKAIKGCKAVVLVFSEQSAISPWVESEINIAFSQHKPIFPYKIDSVKLEEHEEFYLMLNSRHWIDSYPDYRTRFHELVDAVCRAIGKHTPTNEATPVPVSQSQSAPQPAQNEKPASKPVQKYLWLAIATIAIVVGILTIPTLFDSSEDIYYEHYIEEDVITHGEEEVVEEESVEEPTPSTTTITVSDRTVEQEAEQEPIARERAVAEQKAEQERIARERVAAEQKAEQERIAKERAAEQKAKQSTKIANNEIWYTSTDGKVVTPNNTDAFNAKIISNTYSNGKGVITFDSDLTTIVDYAFYNCRSLTSVTIPDSVTRIGNYAFEDCSSLTSVTIGDSVTTIGGYAFYNCSSLTSVAIPDSVTTIKDGAFAVCLSLAEFKGKFAADGGRCLIKDNTIIAYANASGTTYTIHDSVTTIGDGAFFECRSLTSVTIPDSVTTIGEAAFTACYSLTSVTIGDSVTTIGNGAFASCLSLAEFKGKFAEDGGRCLIIDGVLNAFAIGCGAAEYTIPDSVTTIGEDAFSACNSLTSVTIPDSVTTIGDYAFRYCRSLTSVYCDATTPPTLGGSSVFDNNASGRKIYVPVESVEAYKSATNWSEYAANIVGYDF